MTENNSATSNIAEAVDEFRVDRDYCIMRIEHIECSDLQGYSENDIKVIELEFHEAQRKILRSLPREDFSSECRITTEFENIVKSIKSRMLDNKPKVVQPVPQETLAKLPKISIKPFDGKLENWVSYKELFDSLIHSRTSISDVEKLHYLLTSVQGSAYELIKSFPLTGDNYKHAYKTLADYYDRKRQIAIMYYEKLLNCESVKNKNDLDRVYRTFNENLNILAKFNLPDQNFMLYYLLWSKLDNATREAFELQLVSNIDIPSYDELKNFVEKRSKALENSNPKPTNFVKPQNKSKASFVVTDSTCVVCNGKHCISKCVDFLKLDVKTRFTLVKENKLCILCFSSTHRVKTCRAARCSVCKASHNTLLHFDNKPLAICDGPVEPPPSTSGTNNTSGGNHTVLTSVTGENTILFSTVKLLVQDVHGTFRPVRALLDCASACNFITKSCMEMLGYSINQDPHAVQGIGGSVTKPLGSLTCKIKPLGHKKLSFDIEALVLPSICADLPPQSVDSSGWSHIANLSLADPNLSDPGQIDLLLNADIFVSSLLPGIRRGEPGQPTALKTIFGWIVMGECNQIPSTSSALVSSHSKNNKHCFFVSNSSETLSLDDSLKKFWELENVGTSSKTFLSEKDHQCEEYFRSNYYRNAEGRFVVPLPFVDTTDKPVFVDSREIAEKRLLSLERKLNSNPNLKLSYVEFIEDYQSRGHMEEVEKPSTREGQFYYIPHFGIVRDSVTTPLRVVFDAGCKDAKGNSLNSTLLAGPKLQTNIFDLLIRFRWHAVVFTGDVKQMYRQILVPQEDAEYQRILWRPSPASPVRDYRLVTVTYGVSSAPYQALRTMVQLASDAATEYPSASTVLARDIYIDDVITGADSVDQARSLQMELTRILSLGGFHLRKWTSNSSDFLEGLPPSDLYSEEFKHFDEMSDISLKILGLLWQPQSDSFRFRVVMTDEGRCTKRTILSEIAKIYDPLGFLSPVTFLAKYCIQLTWLSGVSWDSEVPENIRHQWLEIKAQLSSLSAVDVPRRMIQNFEVLQLHGFCDASERGFCGVIYCRIINKDGTISVQLVCAKSKVAPLRKLSIPRLELQAAVLLSDLMLSVVEALKPFHLVKEIFTWTDSSVVLAWLKSCPSRWKTFVANRVSHVQEVVPPESWHHVRSADNPADCGSRGLLPRDLVAQTCWWTGPVWLAQPCENWPKSLLSVDKDIVHAEEKITTLVVSNTNDLVINLLDKFSSLLKLKRVLAYCFRFAHNCRQVVKEKRMKGSLQPAEIHRSLAFLVKNVQEREFSSELELLRKQTPNSLPKSFRKLSPFLDEAGLLRVGGRLANAKICYEAKHPMLLPRSHRLTSLIIEEYHIRFMHPGAQTLQNLIARHFWILSCKRAIRSVISGCIKCFRVSPKLAPTPFMGNYPEYRVNQLKCFSNSVVDYGGPFNIAFGRGRGARTFKGYICVFVCTSTKAIHIELASELSTEAFLAALRRFIARRGRCSHLVSDQGRNFIGASNYLGSLMQQAADSQEIKFSFNPPGSPHFNGLAEAGIKSVKTHLARVIGSQRLTYEEFYTVLTQIEAMLNSRPLTPLSADSNDLAALTPGNFLTLEPLSIMPEENLVDLKISAQQRWKLIQQIHQAFWHRWQREYIHTLQQRAKWDKTYSNITVGTMVLVVNEQLEPLKWPLGRIVAIHPGADGTCRVVTVKTGTGQYKRPVAKICPLPVAV